MTAFKNFQRIAKMKRILNKSGAFLTVLGIFLLLGFTTFARPIVNRVTELLPNVPITVIINGVSGTPITSVQIPLTVNPRSFTVSGGTLPAGLSISSTGLISGTPSVAVAGTPGLTLTIKGVAPGQQQTVFLNFVILAPLSVPSNLTITDAIGTFVQSIVSATNNPTGYTIESGKPPAGLSFDLTTGIISGTPLPTATIGQSSMYIFANNAAGNGVTPGTITFNIASPVPSITSATTMTATEGVALPNNGYKITATNNPTSYSVSSLPSGLTFNSTNATISGTPVVAGTYNIVLGAANSTGTGTSSLTLVILPPVPVISSAASVIGAVSSPFTYVVVASNNPYQYQATSPLPTGLSLNSATGVITGTPTVATPAKNYIIAVTNAGGVTNFTLNIAITPPIPVIKGARFVNGVVSQSFSYMPTLLNPDPNTNTAWAISEGALPPGLVLTASTGLISGTPTATGFYSFTLSATNNNPSVTGYKEIFVYIPIANGTANTVAMFTSNTSLGNSDIVDYPIPQFVGVFTTVQPAPNYSFAVKGDALFTRIVVKNYSAWPDYVFDNDYKLTPLAEVERYINEHKHLSGLPSASDIKKDGIDVAVNQGVLLQKIEELTLYIIEQNKKTAEQDKKIDQLQNENDQLQELKKEVEGLKELLQKK